MFSATLGVIALALDAIGFIPYIRDIFLGKTKPERASFWIFSLILAITLAAQLTEGVSWAAVFSAISLLYGIVLSILSIRYGYGKFKKKDTLSVLIAIAGLILWLITDQPLAAVLIVIAVDFAGFWLILVKSWEAPYTETLFSWVMSATAAVLVIISVGKFDLVQLSYLIYSGAMSWGLVLLLIYRRRVISKKLGRD